MAKLEIHIGDGPRGAVVVRINNGGPEIFQGVWGKGWLEPLPEPKTVGTAIATHQAHDLMLTAATAAKIEAAGAELMASQEGRLAADRGRYQGLCDAAAGAWDDWHALSTRRIEAAMRGPDKIGQAAVDEAHAKAGQAQAAANDFLAAHPEILAAIEADRAEQVARHQWD